MDQPHKTMYKHEKQPDIMFEILEIWPPRTATENGQLQVAVVTHKVESTCQDISNETSLKHNQYV